MQFGFKHWHRPTPAIIKYITGLLLSISAGITGFSWFTNDPIMMKIGGFAFLGSCVIPKLFGIPEEKKDEEPIQ
jgi:hypothetical protein